MRFFAGLLAVALLVAPQFSVAQERIERGNLVFENVPDIPDELTERLRQYQNTRSAFMSDWRPDGEAMLISTRFGDVPQLHVIEEPLGARQQVTFFSEPVYGGNYQPDSTEGDFIFSKDRGGDEFYQVFLFDGAEGESRMLTDGESRNGAAIWSNAGDKIALFSTRRDGRNWDIWTVAPDGPETSEMIYEADGTWYPVDWSPDDSKLLIGKYVSITESLLGVLDLESGALEIINEAAGPAAYPGGLFSKDGRGVYLVTDLDSEFRTLRYYDLESGELTEITGDVRWDVEDLDLSDDGKHIAVVMNESGRSNLKILRTRDHAQVRSPELPAGIVSGLAFSPDGKSLAINLNRATAPTDVYVYELGGDLVRWTESEVGGLDQSTFVEPEFFTYETFDSEDGGPEAIPAFIYKPAGKGPHPVVISIHGGPEGQARPGFSPTYQFWVNELSAAVIRPNVRGSAGYGKSYVALDNGFKREDSVKDIGALLDWIAGQPDLDNERVVVYGGSYGGYMVLASMTHYDDRLAGGVDIVGISNFVTFLENTQDYRRDLRRVEYGDERDPEMRAHLEKISPLNNAEKITKPLFIVQGLNDPRVPVSESEQMLEILKEGGGTVWYLMAKDEGHGFAKKSNRDVQSAATALFLEQIFNGSATTN